MAASPAAPEQAARPLQGVRVLLVEDTPDTRDLLTFVLQSAGATVWDAETARDGLDSFHRHQPQVVVTDLAMPERDGQWLLEQIRLAQPTVPVLAVTAFSGYYAREAALQAGFADYLTKPVDAEVFCAAVVDCVQRPPIRERRPR